MRELKVVGLDLDGKRIICECDASGEKFILRRRRPVARLRRVATRPSRTTPRSISRYQACCVPRRFKPRSAPAPRSSRSPRLPVSISSGSKDSPIRCCWSAHARPSWQAPRTRCSPTVPSVLTLLETVTSALVARGLDPEAGRLGRLAQRGRPLDGAAGLEGGIVRQRRALPFHPWRAWRHRDRVRRRGMRADRPRLRPAAAAAGPRCSTRLRGSPSRPSPHPSRTGRRATAGRGPARG